MDNRDQPSFNPSYYPHHVEYGQPEPHPGNGPQGYQQNQQPVYLPLASFSTPYPYPMAHEQQAVYGMSPDFLMPQGSTLGYSATEVGPEQYMPSQGMPQWTSTSQNAVDGSRYGAIDPARALTPPPLGHPPWAFFPDARSSTPQAHALGQGHHPHQNQQISLTEETGNRPSDTLWYRPDSSTGKFSCPTCSSPHARRADLLRHIRSVHTQESPYRCLGCSQAFVRSDARGTHWKNEPACKAEHQKRESGP